MKPDLDAIEARAAAATPGPWEDAYGGGGDKHGKFVITEYFVRRPEDDVSIAADIIDPAACKPSEANAQFIAHARTDIPALVADLREAYAMVDSAHAREDAMDLEIKRLKAWLAIEREQVKARDEDVGRWKRLYEEQIADDNAARKELEEDCHGWQHAIEYVLGKHWCDKPENTPKRAREELAAWAARQTAEAASLRQQLDTANASLLAALAKMEGKT